MTVRSGPVEWTQYFTLPPNVQTGDYTLVAADFPGVVIAMTSAAIHTLTIPTNASVPLPVGALIPVCQAGAAPFNIVGAGGVTVVVPPPYSAQSLGQNAIIWLWQNAANSWKVTGDLNIITAGTILATRVNAFMNTLGINIHPEQGGVYANINGLVTDIAFCNFRLFRNSSFVDSVSLAACQALFNNGLRMVCLSNSVSNPVIATMISQIKSIFALAPNPIFCIEGPNEPANFPLTYNGVTSTLANTHPGFEPVVFYCRDMHAAINSDTVLGPAGILFSSSTEAGGEPDNSGLQFLTIPAGANTVTYNTSASTASGNAVLHFTNTTLIQVGANVYGVGVPAAATVSSIVANTSVTLSATTTGVANGASIRFGCKVPDGTGIADIIGQHIYPMNNPQQAQWVDQTTDSFSFDMGIEWVNTWNSPSYAGYASTAIAFGFPHIITEGGISTGTPGAAGINVTQSIQGKNVLSGWLSAVFLHGYSAFCFYQVYDFGGEQNGFFTTTATPKSVATYLHNFTTVINDIGPNRNTFTPGQIGYTIAGLPAQGHSALVQHSNGTYYLFIWNNIENWNFAAGTALSNGTMGVPVSVTVTFARAGTINVYDPTIGTAAQQTIPGNQVTFSLFDYPQIISFI